jgi:hypothetical protein
MNQARDAKGCAGKANLKHMFFFNECLFEHTGKNVLETATSWRSRLGGVIDNMTQKE